MPEAMAKVQLTQSSTGGTLSPWHYIGCVSPAWAIAQALAFLLILSMVHLKPFQKSPFLFHWFLLLVIADDD